MFRMYGNHIDQLIREVIHLEMNNEVAIAIANAQLGDVKALENIVKQYRASKGMLETPLQFPVEKKYLDHMIVNQAVIDMRGKDISEENAIYLVKESMTNLKAKVSQINLTETKNALNDLTIETIVQLVKTNYCLYRKDIKIFEVILPPIEADLAPTHKLK